MNLINWKVLINTIISIWLVFLSLNSVKSKELSIYDFDDLLKQENYLFVLFQSSEGCKKCSRVLFTWQLLEKRFQPKTISSKFIIGQVDCSIHQDLCAREYIKTLPTVKFYHAISDIKTVIERYDSQEFDLVSLQKFIFDRIKPIINSDTDQNDEDEEQSSLSKTLDLEPNEGLYELTDEDSALFLSEGQHFVNFYAPWCSHCKNLKPKWEMLAKSMESNEHLKISQIDCSTYIHTCKSRFKIKAYPTLLWISNGKVVARYEGPQELTSIRQFINLQINKMLTRENEEVYLDENYRRRTSNVFSLNSDDFKHVIESSISIFVHFTVPWSRHCQQMKDEWDKLSLRFGRVKIGRVDCSLHEELCAQEKIDSYPTLILYKEGTRLPEYDGKRTAESFKEYLRKEIPPLELKDEL